MLHANDQGLARPSVTRISEECHLHRDTVRRALRDLEAAGEIVAEATGRNFATTYRIAYSPADTPRPRTDRARGRPKPRAGSADAARGEPAPKLEVQSSKLKSADAASPRQNGDAGANGTQAGTFLPGTGWIEEPDPIAPPDVADDPPDTDRNLSAIAIARKQATATRRAQHLEDQGAGDG